MFGTGGAGRGACRQVHPSRGALVCRLMHALTAEQRAVVQCAAAPGRRAVHGVVCAAGTGKTSTLVAVARALLSAGHRCVHYAVFNRAAVEEARLLMPGGASVGTLHSFARLLLGARVETGSARTTQAVHAAAVSAALDQRVVACELQRFLVSSAMPAEWAARGAAARAAIAAFWSLDPVGPGAMPVGHDIYMKHAQVCASAGEARMVTTALLVDESQDLSGCQVQFVLAHRARSQIFFVGDIAQAIYGFRGARASAFARACNSSLKLTVSFRFGPAIACVVNADQLSVPDRRTSMFGKVSGLKSIRIP